jgi:hypothetical protein
MNKLDHDIQHAAAWLDQPAQQANSQSAQPCGCDAGASYVCKWHQDIPAGAMPAGVCCDEEADVNDSRMAAVAAYAAAPVDRTAVGIGGAPTRVSTLPDDAASRKQYPIASGFMDYFPDAIAAIAHLSWVGNEQHNPGMPLHWDRSKSADEADTCQRHFLARGTRDKDGVRHTVKFAWRALALLQKELEQEKG